MINNDIFTILSTFDDKILEYFDDIIQYEDYTYTECVVKNMFHPDAVHITSIIFNIASTILSSPPVNKKLQSLLSTIDPWLSKLYDAEKQLFAFISKTLKLRPIDSPSLPRQMIQISPSKKVSKLAPKE